MAPKPMPSWGLTCAQSGCTTSAIYKVPGVGRKLKQLHNPHHLGGPNVGKLPSWGPLCREKIKVAA